MMRRHLIARALILREQAGQTLVLLNEISGVTPPFLPGGRVESDESVVRALQRELDEELGIHCEVGPYLGAVEHRWPDDIPTDYEVNHIFRVVCPSLGDPVIPRETDHRFFWCPVDSLADSNLHPRHSPASYWPTSPATPPPGGQPPSPYEPRYAPIPHPFCLIPFASSLIPRPSSLVPLSKSRPSGQFPNASESI